MRREREHNAEANAAIDATHLSSQEAANRPSEPDVDIDSVDIDVPGWEEKGRWIFYLELTTGKFLGAIPQILDLLTFCRLLKVDSVPDLLLCVVHVLWHAYPHNPRCGAHYTVFSQTYSRFH